MSLSKPHPTEPYDQTGVKLGDEQFALAGRVGGAGRLALVGIGIEPGMADVFARYAADELFSEIEELGVRDGANLTVAGYDFAPRFSIWTTIEECLNPPVIYEGTAAGSPPRRSASRRSSSSRTGIGPVECVNVEHEEVLLMPRWIDAGRVTFKYGLGDGVHRRAQGAAQARPGPDDAGQGRRRRGVAPRRRGRGAARTRRNSATGCPARPARDCG